MNEGCSSYISSLLLSTRSILETGECVMWPWTLAPHVLHLPVEFPNTLLGPQAGKYAPRWWGHSRCLPMERHGAPQKPHPVSQCFTYVCLIFYRFEATIFGNAGSAAFQKLTRHLLLVLVKTLRANLLQNGWRMISYLPNATPKSALGWDHLHTPKHAQHGPFEFASKRSTMFLRMWAQTWPSNKFWSCQKLCLKLFEAVA